MRIVTALLLSLFTACSVPSLDESTSALAAMPLDAAAPDDGDCFEASCASQLWDEPDPEQTSAPPAPAPPTPDESCVSHVEPEQPGDCAGEPEPPCPLAPAGYQQKSPNIASGASCRGACGPNCPATCKPGPDVTTCLEWQTADCRWHSKICTYPTLSCGSHAGCRTHDACYDACPVGWPGIPCRRVCDEQCVTKHGLKKCTAWMKGKGPYDQWIDYAAKGTAATYDTTCY